MGSDGESVLADGWSDFRGDGPGGPKMKAKQAVKMAVGGVAVLMVGLQLVPVERVNPPISAPLGLPAGEVGEILTAACRDCHSNETVWPWYAQVAPAKFLIAKHVKDGRAELNFSTWGEYSLRRQGRKFEEIVELVEDGSMPERSYTWLHPDARLTAAQREALVRWAQAELARVQAEQEAEAAAEAAAASEADTGEEGTPEPAEPPVQSGAPGASA